MSARVYARGLPRIWRCRCSARWCGLIGLGAGSAAWGLEVWFARGPHSEAVREDISRVRMHAWVVHVWPKCLVGARDRHGWAPHSLVAQRASFGSPLRGFAARCESLSMRVGWLLRAAMACGVGAQLSPDTLPTVDIRLVRRARHCCVARCSVDLLLSPPVMLRALLRFLRPSRGLSSRRKLLIWTMHVKRLKWCAIFLRCCTSSLLFLWQHASLCRGQAPSTHMQERMHGLETVFNATVVESRRVLFGIVRRAMCVVS